MRRGAFHKPGAKLESVSGVSASDQVHWLVGYREPQKQLPCLKCGKLIVTDRGHRLCPRCSGENARDFHRGPARITASRHSLGVI